MNCRNCGAAMQPVAGAAYFRCQYCGTFEFPTTTDDRVATRNELTDFPCPVCHKPLGAATVEGYAVCFCGTCHGVLATNVEFSNILGKLRAEYADRPGAPRGLDPVELRRRVGCPKCKKGMDTHPYGGGGNVVIDTCPRCHLIWLDAGEMETIARHRPKCGTVGLLPVAAVGPPEGPRSPVRWAWEDAPPPADDFSDGVSLVALFRRLFR
jgi:Zn-finger nucleic acid-binding protein